MESWKAVAALADLERKLLTGDRAERIDRAATQAMSAGIRLSRQLSAQEFESTPPRAHMGFTWLPLTFAVLAVSILPVGSMEPAAKIVAAAVLAALTLVASLPIGIASIRSRRSDESHTFQIATCVCLLVTSIAALLLRPAGSDAALLVVLVSTAGTVLVSLPQILLQRRWRREIDAELRARRLDERKVAELTERALATAGVHAHGSPATPAWQRAVDSLPPTSPVRELCRRFGVGAATVWLAGHPYGDAVVEAASDHER